MGEKQFEPEEGRWSTMLEDVLGLILNRLPYMDHLRFSVVCKSWSLVAAKKLYHPTRQIPWLMIPGEEESESCGFYSLSDKKVRTLNLPEFRGMRCAGSFNGWLVTLDERADISLWNPFSRARIQLPPLTTLPCVWDVVHDSEAGTTQYIICTDKNGEYPFTVPAKQIRDTFIWKAVLSTQPALTGDCNDCVVMIIFGDRYELAFCKVGDKSWTALEGPCRRPIDDIIFYKDQFYSVAEPGGTVAWDVFGPSPMVTEIAHLEMWIHAKKYLVELRGDLLLVVRCWHSPPDDCHVDDLPQTEPDDSYIDDDLPQPEPDDYYVYDPLLLTTARFKVFKLNWNTRRWKQVKCIGDYVLFLGGNQSMSLSARDFSECKGNHIYFCDDEWDSFLFCKAYGNDLGIYNIEDGSFDQYYDKDSQIIRHPPIWVTPNPY